MLFKFKQMKVSFVGALILLISGFTYVETTHGSCEIIEVDKKYPL